MGVLHFPRINFKGLIMINVGTANNDDYSGQQFPDGSPNAGQPVRLADSVNVQPITYGMTDEQWNEWALTPLNVYKPPRGVQKQNKSEGAPANTAVIPGEWNFYGDMGLTMMNVNVTGVSDPAGMVPPQLKAQLLEAQLSFNNRSDNTGRSTGMLIDVNPEDVNSSQIFADFLSCTAQGAFLFSGTPSKAVTRWINFQRNCNLTGSNGAAGTFQMTVPLADLAGQPIVQALPQVSPEGAPLIGIICRFNLFRGMQPINVFKYPDNQQWITQMLALYANLGINPDYCEIQATVAPWFEGEPASCPVGRTLMPTQNTIPVPAGCKGNGPQFSLCPAIASVDWSNSLISLDFSASFPEWYQGNYDPLATGNNPKWNFGALSLGVVYQGVLTPLGSIDYTNPINDGAGWVFDIHFDPSVPGMNQMIAEGDLTVVCDQIGPLLAETTYLIVSDQSGVYADVNPTQPLQTTFLNDSGDPVPISFQIYKKGVLLSGADKERLALWYYDTTPNQEPGNRTFLADNYSSGDPISFPVTTPGNRLITAVLSTYSPPAQNYGNFNNVAFPIINLRILPYNDYSVYYTDPGDPQPVGNDLLTFDVIYNEALRNYYLLYPAMSQRVPLNDPAYWSDAEMARRLMQRVSIDAWGTAEAMPRTRDLSQSRRTLITAWCLKFLQPPVTDKK
jgi:hypothetical protein